MDRNRPSRRRSILLLAAAGTLVGAVVAGASSGYGAWICGQDLAPSADCFELVSTLAFRTGAAAAVATVFIFLLMAGLFRTVIRNEEDRATKAMEAHLARKLGGEVQAEA